MFKEWLRKRREKAEQDELNSKEQDARFKQAAQDGLDKITKQMTSTYCPLRGTGQILYCAGKGCIHFTEGMIYPDSMWQGGCFVPNGYAIQKPSCKLWRR